MSKPDQVRVQELEDGAVTRAETAAATLEAEHPEDAGRRGESKEHRILDAVWLHPEVVQAHEVEFAPGQEVRGLDRAEAPRRMVSGDGILRLEDGRKLLPVEAAEELFLT